MSDTNKIKEPFEISKEYELRQIGGTLEVRQIGTQKIVGTFDGKNWIGDAEAPKCNHNCFPCFSSGMCKVKPTCAEDKKWIKKDLPERENKKTEGDVYREKFSYKFLEIARWADDGNDVAYGKGLACLEIETAEYIETLLQEQESKIHKAFGNCILCYGKGYSTVKRQTISSVDFGNEKIEMEELEPISFCTCDRGKQVGKHFERRESKIRQETIEKIKKLRKRTHLLRAGGIFGLGNNLKEEENKRFYNQALQDIINLINNKE